MKQTSENHSASLGEATWLHRLPVIAGVLALLLIIGYAFTFKALPAGENPAAWGTFGDYIGGLLNPLISLFTLMVAMQVWKLQKTELLETRKAVEEQGKTAEQQRREQRFFDLLNIYQRTIDSIGVSLPGRTDRPEAQFQGKAALNAWFRNRMPDDLRKFSRHGLDAKWPTPTGERTIDRTTLEQTWQQETSTGTFDHYLRVIYRLLMDSESLLGEQHYRHVKILRAQLNRNELLLLAFNMWLDDEGEKMIPLAAKYGLLKHLPQGHLRTQLEKELSPEVFGRKFAKSQADLNSSEAAPC
ncbi:putative phage abortive infection protein [Rhodoferax fermentans]|uniref:Phage abortive infection protein n=1 Tax=Rhodoferax fermentans TaxID=28066 RepID=A0A1T1AWZ2_RHOFE|nr:putative phage abortive infection protein [Rhodoferax fermentans]MBK1684051.1 hypothetical protein [Rhodoferax fermentans]OOV08601.1 hypothetical protein RF819_19565 [Rhodoferax fermentans]